MEICSQVFAKNSASAFGIVVWQNKTLDDYILRDDRRRRESVWLSRELERVVGDEPDSGIAPRQIKLLLLMRRFGEWLTDDSQLKQEIAVEERHVSPSPIGKSVRQNFSSLGTPASRSD